MLVLQVAQDLAKAEDAHAERHEVQPVGHFRHVEGEALGAGFDVAADQTQQQPRTIMVNALSSEPLASATEATSPSTISEKYSAGPN